MYVWHINRRSNYSNTLQIHEHYWFCFWTFFTVGHMGNFQTVNLFQLSTKFWQHDIAFFSSVERKPRLVVHGWWILRLWLVDSVLALRCGSERFCS